MYKFEDLRRGRGLSSNSSPYAPAVVLRGGLILDVGGVYQPEHLDAGDFRLRRVSWREFDPDIAELPQGGLQLILVRFTARPDHPRAAHDDVYPGEPPGESTVPLAIRPAGTVSQLEREVFLSVQDLGLDTRFPEAGDERELLGGSATADYDDDFTHLLGAPHT